MAEAPEHKQAVLGPWSCPQSAVGSPEWPWCTVPRWHRSHHTQLMREDRVPRAILPSHVHASPALAWSLP